MKTFLVVILVFFLSCFLIFIPKNLPAQWAMTYGSGGDDYGYVVIHTSDDGYLIAGATSSFGLGSSEEGGPGGYDLLVMKIDAKGDIEWQKIYGTPEGDDKIYEAVELVGGGYLLAGKAWTDKPVDAYGALLMRLSADGELVWRKLIYFSNDISNERAYEIQSTNDNAYLVKCFYSGSVPGYRGNYFIKIGTSGELIWVRRGEQSWVRSGGQIVSLPDGRYLLAGSDYGGIKVGIFDANFNYITHQAFGNGSSDYYEVTQALRIIGGGYLILGRIVDDPIHPTDYKGDFVIKLSSDLNIIWQKMFPGDIGPILPTSDGGMLSFYDGALHKIDSAGNIDWEKKYTDFWVEKITETNTSDGYLVLGYTQTRGEGGLEIMLLRLDLNGNLDSSCSFEEPVTSVLNDLDLVPIYGQPPSVGDEISVNEGEKTLVEGTPEMVPHLICPTQPYIYLSPYQIFFGADGGGANPVNVTEAQGVLLCNTSGGSWAWSVEAESTTGWLQVSPDTGTGDAYITVSVDPTGLSPGEYVGAITVTCADAFNSPKKFRVVVRVYGEGYKSESEPFGAFDTPVDGSIVYGNTSVTGWVLDDIQVERVVIKRAVHPDDPPEVIGDDGLVYIGDAVFVKGARPDVNSRYYDYPLADRAGWGYMLLTNMLPGGGNGEYSLYAIAEDSNGHQKVLGEKTFNCDNINSTKPFGTIDTPGQGEQIGGSAYVNFAWALTPPPKEIPRDGSTIWVWVDGVPLGHPDYNHYRVDIATLFPDCLNSDGAVGFYLLDTTVWENGLHSLAWSVMDNWGETEGIGSRWIEIFNNGNGDGNGGAMGNTGSAGSAYGRAYYSMAGSMDGREGPGRRGGKTDYEVYLPEDRSGRLEVELVGWRKGWDALVAGSRIDLEKFVYGEENEKNGEENEKRNIGLKEISVRINSGERLEIHLRPRMGEGSFFIIGWGQERGKALPPGSFLDKERGVFYWLPGPGLRGQFFLHFAASDGLKIGPPVTVVVKVE